jgi:hypothetical protein
MSSIRLHWSRTVLNQKWEDNFEEEMCESQTIEKAVTQLDFWGHCDRRRILIIWFDEGEGESD